MTLSSFYFRQLGRRFCAHFLDRDAVAAVESRMQRQKVRRHRFRGRLTREMKERGKVVEEAQTGRLSASTV